MKNVLIIGATRPETIADPDGSNPITHLSGCAPAMAKTLLKGNQLRTTLLTALQRDQLGKATIRLLESSGILYRAIDCEIPTIHQIARRKIDKDPEPENTERPTLTKAIMSPSISQTAQDYDYVIADCNLENEILFDLGRSAQKFIINGTSEERCLRILSSNPWPKTAVKLEESEVNALMEFSEAKTEQQLKDVLSTEQLLIHRPRKGWTLHTHNKTHHGNITPQEHQTNCSGTGDAALAALVQAMSMGITDPTEQINDAIAAHLESNPI